jgi:HSP20 family protein
MSITRWQPLADLERMQQRLNRLFGELSVSSYDDSEKLDFMPSAEMEETDQAILLKFEVPGLTAKDIDISVTEDSITVRGERKSEWKSEEEGVVRSEFHYGTFERMMRLPALVQSDQTHAEYMDGILKITLPKAEGERRKVVKVNIEAAD